MIKMDEALRKELTFESNAGDRHLITPFTKMDCSHLHQCFWECG